jgi:predicted transcriptional regulator YdeE
VSESESYSGTISLPTRRVVGAFEWALLTLRGPCAKRSQSWEAAHDGWVAVSHVIAHGDVEFELESDPSSKSVCWS